MGRLNSYHLCIIALIDEVMWHSREYEIQRVDGTFRNKSEEGEESGNETMGKKIGSTDSG